MSKAYVDDAKLTDHHAIIPTYNTPSANLPDRQRNIYSLVALRFLSIFMPAEVRDETTVILTIGEHSFRAKGFVIKEAGWTAL
ncbi:DNA topoisomerase, partial [Staphylococcus aureus]